MHKIIAKVVKPAWQEELSTAQRQASHRCALALLGGQFADLRSALGDPEFHDVSIRLVTETLESLRRDEFVSAAAKQRELDRRQKQIEDLLEATGGDSIAAQRDVVWLEQIFAERLMTRADRHAIDGGISVDEIRLFAWCFELAEKADRRYWSYRFQYTVHADLVAASDDGTARGDKALHSLAGRIFGDAAYCSKQIKACFAKGLTERPDQGRPANYPREVESVLFRYCAMLRLNDIAVFKSTCIDLGMRLLEGTEASLNFALVVNGKYAPSPFGGVEWDMRKWNEWYKRRFMGDRKAGGARIGNQVLLDINRAKWHSYQAMEPYFLTHVQALVDEGICYYNQKYDNRALGEDGVPLEPIAFWVEGEEWRAVSFDESRLDDTTHGAGGDRKGRTEQSIRCGPWDHGECIGQKSATHTSSLVGGSNAKGEPVPPWFCLRALTCDDSLFALGPVAIVNGHSYPSRGSCNAKGSVDGKHAILFLIQSLLPMFQAHGGLSADKRAVVACDGVGTHMTTEFFETCRKHHIIIVLRTPWCSNRIQFEDLVNFWQLKNAKDVGWYKAKQQAVIAQVAETGAGGLSFARQLSILVPAWNAAFSKETNLAAWKKGGFGADGITMKPLWLQKKMDSGSSVKQRALSKAEMRRGATEKLKLNKTYEFDKVLAVGPHKRTVDEVCALLERCGSVRLALARDCLICAPIA
tara:strand:+ start:712 stop:2802 length:2091 start_codon:yes stop_codon:yes gene_type:complete